jgi:hypothetical protein
MVNMDILIAQVRQLNAEGMTLQQIHNFVVTDMEVNEGDFFLAYKGAEILPGWVTPERLAERQSFYEDLFG